MGCIERSKGMIKMKNKKIISMLMASTMLVSLAGCGKANNEPTSGDTTTTPTEAAGTETATPTESEVEVPEETRIIKVGTWYDQYYTSDHTSIDDNPNVTNTDTAQMQLDNMRAIEEKYNCEFRFVNLTWEGVIESINTSIAAGKPECDMYLVDLQFGVPAVLNGYAQALEDFLPSDNDVFNDQVVMKSLNIMGDEKSYLFSAQFPNLNSYMLGFNATMIEEAGLENPQDLYDRGEWTWDKFREYLLALTQDTNGDGATDVYGYCGTWTNALAQLLMSNGAGIASSTTQSLDSPATIETLELIYNIYNVDKSARPWNQDNWDDNVTAFASGLCAFFTDAPWINSSYMPADADWELGMVPWPIGPSGNQETNNTVATSGAYYIIPVGVEDPEYIYNVFYDWCNWFNYDTELRDDTEWAEDYCYTERNFNYLVEMGKNEEFDLWQSSGVSLDIVGLMNGEKTASQVAEESKQLYQDYLDQYFK